MLFRGININQSWLLLSKSLQSSRGQGDKIYDKTLPDVIGTKREGRWENNSDAIDLDSNGRILVT